MPKELLNKNERSGGITRKLGLLAAGLAMASTATFIGHEMEKATPAGEVTMSDSQQAFLDKTAAATAMRLLNDRFALTKQVSRANGLTTINVEQSMPKIDSNAVRPASLTFTFEGASKATNAAGIEQFFQSQHPHIESVQITKEGTFTLNVTNSGTGQAEASTQMPSEDMQPHSGTVNLGDFTPYERALAVANGMNGADSPAGVIPDYVHNVLPSNIPPSLDPRS